MLNVLVTGSKGQLGSEIASLSSAYTYNFIFTDRDTLDISNYEEVESLIDKKNINIIINCAAYTAVDKAEDEKDLADKINHLSVENLAKLAKIHAIQLIHVSTDYVFDGEAFKPYIEEDTTNPNGVYGRTKLLGEKAMQVINPEKSIIIRTSWVYSSFGNNFVKTMLRLGKERDSLGVIFDQVGTPTYAKDLAKTILDVLEKIDTKNVEIYNYSNEGVISWYDFSKEIMNIANIECLLYPIETKEYPTPAKRPHYSILNKSKIKKAFNMEISYWKDSLYKCLDVLGEVK